MGTSTVSKRKRSRAAKSTLAIVLALLLALGGTFAWTSFSQRAKNEFKATINPGGRLHDDFIWTTADKNKDIYVENFTSPDNFGVSIYARVMLREYLEIGKGAGEYRDPATTEGLTAYPAGASANEADKDKWEIHKFDSASGAVDKHESAANEIHKHFTMNYGGSTVYMPTFNRDKDSLDSDIHGALSDLDENDQPAPYANYKAYEEGQGVEDVTYYGEKDDKGNKTGSTETHVAQPSANATVISMAEWTDPAGSYKSQPGPYWVYDTDGWAYWAQAITPGTATGLLLDNVTLGGSIGEEWYYVIDAVGEFVTADEWGGEADDYYFGLDGGTKKAMSNDAHTLLVNAADKASFDEERQNIKRAPTAMEADSTVGMDVSRSFVTLEGRQYIKLAEDGDLALLLTKELVDDPVYDTAANHPYGAFGTTSHGIWRDCIARAWCNGAYYDSLVKYTKEEIKETSIKTKPSGEETDASKFIETIDKAFLLTEADLSGRNSLAEETREAKYYTFGNSRLVPASCMKVDPPEGCGNDRALWAARSLCFGQREINYVNEKGDNNRAWDCGSALYFMRPAFWIQLDD